LLQHLFYFTFYFISYLFCTFVHFIFHFFHFPFYVIFYFYFILSRAQWHSDPSRSQLKLQWVLDMPLTVEKVKYQNPQSMARPTLQQCVLLSYFFVYQVLLGWMSFWP